MGASATWRAASRWLCRIPGPARTSPTGRGCSGFRRSRTPPPRWTPSTPTTSGTAGPPARSPRRTSTPSRSPRPSCARRWGDPLLLGRRAHRTAQRRPLRHQLPGERRQPVRQLLERPPPPLRAVVVRGPRRRERGREPQRPDDRDGGSREMQRAEQDAHDRPHAPATHAPADAAVDLADQRSEVLPHRDPGLPTAHRDGDLEIAPGRAAARQHPREGATELAHLPHVLQHTADLHRKSTRLNTSNITISYAVFYSK